MTKVIYLCVAVALVQAVRSFHTGDSTCDRAKVLDCIGTFYRYENLTEGVFPNISETRLRQICREYEVVDKCLSPLRDSCTMDEQYYYLGLDGAFQYVCDEKNIEVYLRHASCFGQRSLQAEGHSCLMDFYLTFYIYFTKTKVCSYLDTYIQCIKSAVKSSCGQEAASWQYAINEKHMSAIILDFGCELGKTHLSTGITVAIIIVVTLVITSSMAAVLWVCRRRIIDHVARTRAQHIHHYSTQRDDDFTAANNQHSVNYPATGYDQSTSSTYYSHHPEADSPDGVTSHVTGIANKSYVEDSQVTVDVTSASHTQMDRNPDVVCSSNANDGFI